MSKLTVTEGGNRTGEEKGKLAWVFPDETVIRVVF